MFIAPAPHAGGGPEFSLRSGHQRIRSLDDRQLFRRIAISYRICRIYALDNHHNGELAAVLDRLTGAGAPMMPRICNQGATRTSNYGSVNRGLIDFVGVAVQLPPQLRSNF